MSGCLFEGVIYFLNYLYLTYILYLSHSQRFYIEVFNSFFMKKDKIDEIGDIYLDRWASIYEAFESSERFLVSSPFSQGMLFVPKNYSVEEDVRPHLTISSGVHGDEVEGIEGMLKFLENDSEVLEEIDKPVMFLLGNPRAILANVRFVEANLNRRFGSNDTETYEGRRATEIIDSVRGTRYLLDLHCTHEETLRPYGIFPDREDLLEFLQNLGTSIEDVILVNALSPQQGMCFDEHFMFNEVDYDCTPITIEVGSIGQGESAVNVAYTAIVGALVASGVLADREVVKGLDLKLWEQSQKVEHSLGYFLDKGLVNLTYVGENQIIGSDINGRKLRSNVGGVIIFPDYEGTDPNYLVRIASLKEL